MKPIIMWRITAAKVDVTFLGSAKVDVTFLGSAKVDVTFLGSWQITSSSTARAARRMCG